LFITEDNRAVMLDFGAAREVLSKQGRFIRPMYTPGFAAPELYTKKELGPWTDIYSIGASIFTCMVGVPPQSAMERKRDDRMDDFYHQLRGLYSSELIDIVRSSLMLEPLKRPQSVFALQKALRPASQSTSEPDNLLSRLRRLVG
jgi:serine/threonine protein kinase